MVMQLKGIKLSVSNDLKKELALLKTKAEAVKTKHEALKMEIEKAMVHFQSAKLLANRVGKMKEKFGIEPKELNSMIMEMSKTGDYLNALKKL